MQYAHLHKLIRLLIQKTVVEMKRDTKWGNEVARDAPGYLEYSDNGKDVEIR